MAKKIVAIIKLALPAGKAIGNIGRIILELMQFWKSMYFHHCNGDNCAIPMNCISSFSCHIFLATIWRWMNYM